jgi:hypothetical protein
MQTPQDLDIIHKLFDVVAWHVFQSGGDGEGWIISPNYKMLAEEFGKYDTWFTETFSGDEYITFMQGQEGIIFTNEKTASEYEAEIVVRINWW